MMNFPVQSMTRAPLGMGSDARGPTSVILPFCTITMASGRSAAEWPQSVTSMTVPPASTSGMGGACVAGQNSTQRRCPDPQKEDTNKSHITV